MSPTEPLPLHHSWPLSERGLHLHLGHIHDGAGLGSFDANWLARHGIGAWECDLADDSLTWSAGVFDIFGLPRDARISRTETVAFYAEESRAAMERLRAYAIKHRRGFTLDVDIRPATGSARRMRLIAAPECERERVVRLRGLKQDISPAGGRLSSAG